MGKIANLNHIRITYRGIKPNQVLFGLFFLVWQILSGFRVQGFPFEVESSGFLQVKFQVQVWVWSSHLGSSQVL